MYAPKVDEPIESTRYQSDARVASDNSYMNER